MHKIYSDTIFLLNKQHTLQQLPIFRYTYECRHTQINTSLFWFCTIPTRSYFFRDPVVLETICYRMTSKLRLTDRKAGKIWLGNYENIATWLYYWHINLLCLVYYIPVRIFFFDPIVIESICYRTSAKQLINKSNTTGWWGKNWTDSQYTASKSLLVGWFLKLTDSKYFFIHNLLWDSWIRHGTHYTAHVYKATRPIFLWLCHRITVNLLSHDSRWTLKR